MNRTVLLLGTVVTAFAALSAWAALAVGYLGIFAAGFANPGALQILVDLVILCALAIVWLVGDARRRGLNPWPWVAITLLAGSFGPLLYLLRREWAGPAPARGPAQA
jgi:hypothetical protein